MNPNRLALALAAVAFAATLAPAAAPTTRRTVELTITTTIANLAAADRPRVWLPVPPSDAQQDAALVRSSVDAQRGREPARDNEMLCADLAPDADGAATWAVTYRITRREATTRPAPPPPADDRDLRGDALVPINGRPESLLVGVALPADPLLLGRTLAGVVGRHMTYRKDQPGWGRGDAAWACDSRFGNCTDFHSLFLSLARTHGLPARFEIGVSLPPARGRGTIVGYHCWASFYARDVGWVPVDLSEASKRPERADYYFGHLDADRVTFTVGRDLALAPPQAGPPLNFFVFPYAELSGAPLPPERVRHEITYRDELP